MEIGHLCPIKPWSITHWVTLILCHLLLVGFCRPLELQESSGHPSPPSSAMKEASNVTLNQMCNLDIETGGNMSETQGTVARRSEVQVRDRRAVKSPRSFVRRPPRAGKSLPYIL